LAQALLRRAPHIQKVRSYETPGTHSPDDPFYSCEDLLSDDEKQIRDEARTLIDSRCLPKAADYFDQEIFPVELIPETARMGLLGFKLSEY
jgi:glutaryl-CoA dehydrogenase